MLNDLRLALRSIRRQPRFAAATIGTLALGIGASTAIFSLAYSVWLKPLPYADSRRLVTIRATNKTAGAMSARLSDAEVTAYRQGSRSLEAIAAYLYMPIIAKVGDEPSRLQTCVVSRQLFDVLGRRPAIGRSFEERDEVRNAPPVILVSDAFWRRAWGSDPSVIGKTLQVMGMRATVIGVMPPGFAFPYGRTDVWQPLTPNLLDVNRGMRVLEAVGRLREGVPLETAQAELDAIAADLAAARPDTNRGWSAVATLLHDEIFGAYRAAFATLLGAVAFLLLVACANAGGLLLSRQISRQPAIALRIALGATRWRINQELIVESLVLAAIGGAIGVVLAWLGTPILADLLPRATPRVEDVHMTAAVGLTAAAISLATGLLAAVAPALRQQRSLRSNLQLGSPAVSGASRLNLQSVLVVAQVTISVMLVLGGSLMLASFVGLVNRTYGFKPEEVLTAHVSVAILGPGPAMRYVNPTARAALLEDVVRNVATIPGVTSAALVTGYPGSTLGYLGSVPLRAPGRASPIIAALRACSSGYFRTMDVPLMAGRSFADGDVREAVISEALAQQLWSGASAIGQQITLPPSSVGVVAADGPFVIVGVAANMRFRASDEAAIFVPATKSRAFWTDLVVRTTDPAAAAPAVRTMIRNQERDLLVEEMIPLTDVLARQYYLPRAQTFIVTLFAVLSMLLAAIGLYSVMTHFVALRTREFGVMLAIGAKPSDVRKVVIRRGLWLSVIAMIIGSIGAVLLAQTLRSRLFGLQRIDGMALAVTPVLLVACALIATLAAARRVSEVNPIEALKSE